jgi:hypothetical protein
MREALARAKVLYGAEGRNEAALESAAHRWGYSPNSSATNRTVAALVAFGLLEMKDRKARLTERAVHILADSREPSPDRDRLIREAALLPNIHHKLWDRYQGDFPSDATLRHYLITAEGFSEDSAAAFIRLLQETLEFASLIGQPGTQQSDSAPSPAPTKQARPAPRGQPSEVNPTVFTLLGDNEVEFRIRHRISSEEAEDVRQMFEIWLRKIVER